MRLLKPSNEIVPSSQVAEKLLSTYNFQRVHEVCLDAYNNKKMIGLIGEPGYGKTTALKYFQGTNSNVFYLTVKPSAGPVNFWLSLFESVSPAERTRFGLNTQKSLYYIMRSAAKFLNTTKASLLIIDEAGKFSPGMLELLHELRDECSKTTGIVLAGPGYFHRNLTKWVTKQKVGMPEVMRRINYWETLMPPDRGEIKSFCNHYGIEDVEVIKKLTFECKNFGELHNHIVEYHSGNFRL